MKKALTYSLLFTLAAFIFYGGAGVNLINYCCGDCLDAGIKAVVSADCCSTHNHDTETSVEPDFPIAISCAHDCGIKRIEFDWTTGQKDRTFAADVYFTTASFLALSPALWVEPGMNPAMLTAENHPPPILLPRDYLTQLTVLLI